MSEQPSDTAQHIAIVEDEDNIALALKHILSREGYRLTHISEGDVAVEALRADPPDLVLLDVMLPGASGYEICQDMRQDPMLSTTKILMMTARGSAMDRRKGLALGADAFIAKPFELRDLLAQLRGLLADRTGEGDDV